ncbi:MAG: LicD family protein [Gemella morbillorum]|uniref:LicD family protein n=1 Tax=Gemella morbillorum TaxID=29391 RepID=UPI001CB43CA9|nr:LicD family protein [Gemella morbillorum]MBF1209447.1 LicD family protein [Gemella morbillorum]
MLQWLKRSLASALGDKKDIIKKLPIIKTLNNKANTELDSRRSFLLRENFQEVLKIIYNSQLNKYDLWLDFGTLLGFYRENDFINHDLDMDFGIIINDYDDFLEKEKYLIKKGFSRTKEFYYKNRLVELSYSYKGLNVDFIVYRRKADVIESDTIFFMTNALGKPTRYEVYNYRLPFSELEGHNFKAVEIKVPNNTREYLSKLYGEDFEVPNTNYNWKENPIYKRVSSEEANVILL